MNLHHYREQIPVIQYRSKRDVIVLARPSAQSVGKSSQVRLCTYARGG